MDPETSAPNRLEQMLLDESAEPTDLPLSLLTAITNNFSDDQKIGSGRYAVVYKGVLQNGTVAVKKLSMDETFSGEVDCLMRVKHKNIVQFFGYCFDTERKIVDYKGNYILTEVRQRLLCFEYVPGGTLHDYITDVSLGLEWRVCYQIIRGICEGLSYLHETRIVHLDLKPGSILLDYNMVPKICGFDLSRFFHENQSQDLTKNIAGSLAYLAPEYIYTGVITFKSDIYALGVIISEILTGEKIYSSVANVLEGWRNRLGPSGEDTPLEQIEVCAEISIRCLHSNPNKRPAIRRIIELFSSLVPLPLSKSLVSVLSNGDSGVFYTAIQLVGAALKVTFIVAYIDCFVAARGHKKSSIWRAKHWSLLWTYFRR